MKEQPRTIELLSPARDADCGIEAINCGADAVYIGASRYGARAEATNNLDDIARLTDYAHLYGVKIYVTLNTILFDDELTTAKQMAMDLANIGVDALITQDMALLHMQLPIPLHASTQMDIRTPEKARFLSEVGFKRLIVARELSLQQIKEIHQACDTPLEVFVHGALCVSYSGQCYASQYCFNRSANRGECAQFCRMAFDLQDESGNVILKDKHLLSLKDMNRSDSLEELLDAGVSSFKIEGRLKNTAYVKNITAFYRRQIDDILRRRPEFIRSSAGHTSIHFEPQPQKTFNRGYTEYFLHGRTENVASIHTPKSLGEAVGKVKEVKGRTVRVAGTASFHQGDGLCYFDESGTLQGFRINRAENNLLFLSEPQPYLKLHMPLFRNHDAAFEQLLSHAESQRELSAVLTFKDTPDGFELQMQDETGLTASVRLPEEKVEARQPQQNRIITELSKLGGSGFKAAEIHLELSAEYFIPASHLAQWRREVVTKLSDKHRQHPAPTTPIPCNKDFSLEHLDYTANVANSIAKTFYLQHGAKQVDDAFEITKTEKPLLMTCKHCIRYTLGYCPKYGGKVLPPEKRQWFLVMKNGDRFRLEFDCSSCEMKIYACI